MLRFLIPAFLSIAPLVPLPAEARQCGTASFYGGHGDGFAWQTMANGQPMNPNAMITAHPSLPLGSRIRVTNQANGKSVTLVVADRGPWYGGRILDLSIGAFQRIASASSGLATVCYTRV